MRRSVVRRSRQDPRTNAPSSRFSSTVMSGKRPSPCRMWTIPRLASASAAVPSIRRPSNSMVPPDGLSRPEIASSSVVLPCPLGPITTAVWPALTASDSSRSTIVRS
jgi:hypothetical protein